LLENALESCLSQRNKARAELSDAITDAAHLQRERDDARAEVETLKGDVERLGTRLSDEVKLCNKALARVYYAEADNRKLREGIESALARLRVDRPFKRIQEMDDLLAPLLDDTKGREEEEDEDARWLEAHRGEHDPGTEVMRKAILARKAHKPESPTSDALERAREQYIESLGLVTLSFEWAMAMSSINRLILDHLEAAEKGTPAHKEALDVILTEMSNSGEAMASYWAGRIQGVIK
jgi:hypothetical protein